RRLGEREGDQSGEHEQGRVLLGARHHAAVPIAVAERAHSRSPRRPVNASRGSEDGLSMRLLRNPSCLPRVGMGFADEAQPILRHRSTTSISAPAPPPPPPPLPPHPPTP